MNKLSTGLSFAVLFGFSVSVAAGEGMKMMDSDKDGMVSENEMMMMHKKMDTDKNGMLDAKEQKMMMSGDMMHDDKMMKDGMKN